MVALTEAIKVLEYIQRLAQNPSSFTDIELTEQPSDAPVVKALKKRVQGEKDIARLGQEINDKQDQINTLNTKKTNLTNEKNQLTIERDGLIQDKTNLTNELTTKQGEINIINSQITTLQTQLTNTQNDLTTTRTELTEKDNRITQLDQTVKDSALIFQKQINIIDGLTQQLQQAQQQNLGNADYQTHLKADIKRLAQERKDLTKQKKDLEDAKTASESLRDTEIVDLRTQINNKDNELSGLRADKTRLESEKTTLQSNLTNEQTKYTNFLTGITNAIHLVSPTTSVSDYNVAIASTRTQFTILKGWVDYFSPYSPEQVKNSFQFHSQLNNQLGSNNENEKDLRISWTSMVNSYPSPRPQIITDVMLATHNLLYYYIREKFWWDKWELSNERTDFIKPLNHMGIKLYTLDKTGSWNWINYTIYNQQASAQSIDFWKAFRVTMKKRVYEGYRDIW